MPTDGHEGPFAGFSDVAPPHEPAGRTDAASAGTQSDRPPRPNAPTTGQAFGGTGPYPGLALTGRLVVTLPKALWVPLTRGVYWNNRPHVHALQPWTDR
ncbi:hypothetical protein ACQKM2_39615 [Streptomyces sp. NPDC004126]|uniref:hypothetical protein n=1 Tax=Streptomyces sp. NPDC004126 TaxID=3390695 RepID=UPI003D0813B1